MTSTVLVDVAELTPIDAQFINLSKVNGRPVAWRRHSGLPQSAIERAVIRPRLSRYRAAYAAARDTHRADAIISHMPRMTAAVADLSRLAGKRIPHLAFSFNFTALPDKARRARMRAAFSRVDQFAVYTEFEAGIYADAFGIDPARLKPVRWTQDVPKVAASTAHQFATPYVAAVGGEGRDFASLIATARRLPDLRFVIIARPNAALLDVPKNVNVLYNLPGPVCWHVAERAEAVLVPLVSADTCCGHITLVSARLLALPIVTTASQGTRSYTDGFAGTVVVPHADPDAFADAIVSLREDSLITKASVLNDQQLAQKFYDRDIWRDYVVNFLSSDF